MSKLLELEAYKVGKKIAVIKLISVDPKLIEDEAAFTATSNAQIRFDDGRDENHIDSDGWLYIYKNWTDNPIVCFVAYDSDECDNFLKDLKHCVNDVNEVNEVPEITNNEILVRVF